MKKDEVGVTMECPQCSNAVLKGSKFCSKCGLKLDIAEESKANKPFQIKPIFIIVPILVVAFLAIGLLLLSNANDYREFEMLANNNLEEAHIFFEDVRKEMDEDKKAAFDDKVKEHLTGVIEAVRVDFYDFKMTHEEALEILNQVGLFHVVKGETNTAKSFINNLNKSRESFIAGQDYINTNEYFLAIESLKKVIEDDEDYTKAQQLIDESIQKAEKDFESNLAVLLENEDYQEALSLVKKAQSNLPDRAKYTEILKEVERLELAQRMDRLKQEQKIEVISATSNKSFIYSEATVIVQNNHDQVVQEMTVAIMMYDDNGYPVKETGYLDDGSNMFLGSSDNPNIQPGATFGRNRYWWIEQDATVIRACVVEASFYDGSTWQNPYYPLWEKLYLNMPLHEVE